MGYQTRLKRLMIELFHAHPRTAFSVEDVLAQLAGNGRPPSRSSVYRLLHEMSEEGKLQQNLHPDSKKTVYSLSHGIACGHHLHFVCSFCGSSLHVDEFTSAAISQLMAEQCHTFIDMKSSVLTGRCSLCMDSEEDELQHA